MMRKEVTEERMKHSRINGPGICSKAIDSVKSNQVHL